MNISSLLFDRITTLDAIGPTTVLARMPNAKIHFVGPRRGEIRSVHSRLGLLVDYDLAQASSASLLAFPSGTVESGDICDCGQRPGAYRTLYRHPHMAVRAIASYQSPLPERHPFPDISAGSSFPVVKSLQLE